MEAFKIFAQPHVPAGVHEALDEPGEGFFRTFPSGKKCACRRESECEGAWHVSSWTPAAIGETIGSDEWVQFSLGGKPFYWKRRSHETFWPPLEGVKVVWIAEQPAAGGFGTGTRKRVSVLMTSHLGATSGSLARCLRAA